MVWRRARGVNQKSEEWRSLNTSKPDVDMLTIDLEKLPEELILKARAGVV
ncbi:hypothetical protein ES703_90676 [subsurface metagenome]